MSLYSWFLLVTLWVFSVNDPYVVGPPLVFIARPLVSSVVDQLIIMSVLRYL